MRSEQILTFVGIVLLSTVVPLAISVALNNVRTIRGRLVEDLAKLFSFARVGATPLIVPSFELIKYKYDARRDPIKTRSRSSLSSSSSRYRRWAS